MLCPTCARHGIVAALEVADTRKDDKNLRVRRRRVCKQNAQHILDTVEQQVRAPLDGVLVRGRHDDARRLLPFVRDRLFRDVDDGVLNRLPQEEVKALVDNVCADLEEHLPEVLTPLAAQESVPETTHPAMFRGAIDDSTIRDTVERHLRNAGHNAALVQYVLSTRGRVNVAKNEGFETARDLLNWARAAYPGHGDDVPAPALRGEDRWWPPVRPPAEPTTVLKGDRSEPFNRTQLEESVMKALIGRRHPRRFAVLTVDWVLMGLTGQDLVLSSQLAASVMDTLRRVDDIAYLRYASLAKGFTSLGEFLTEARGLVTMPSPALVFDQRAARGDSSATQVAQLRTAASLAVAARTERDVAVTS